MEQMVEKYKMESSAFVCHTFYNAKSNRISLSMCLRALPCSMLVLGLKARVFLGEGGKYKNEAPKRQVGSLTRQNLDEK